MNENKGTSKLIWIFSIWYILKE